MSSSDVFRGGTGRVKVAVVSGLGSGFTVFVLFSLLFFVVEAKNLLGDGVTFITVRFCLLLSFGHRDCLFTLFFVG